MDPLDLMELRTDAAEFARKDILRSMYRKYYKKQIMQGFTPTFLAGVPHDIIATYIEPPPEQKSDWFITIQADQMKKIDPSKFFMQVKKLFKKKEFVDSSCKATLEQSSEDPDSPRGWHIHMVAKGVKGHKGGKLAQSVYQCFQRYCYAPQQVDVKPYISEHHDKYIEHIKCDEKKAKVEADKKIRVAFNLPEFISNYNI